ncbi:Helix-turn-helix domain-containing protein, partial [Dysosmobacter welbionis]
GPGHRLAPAVHEAAADAARIQSSRQQGGRTPRRVTRKDGIHGRDNGQEETPQRFDAFHDGQDP